jgi:cation diffusion facilitator CzcD-associated flavoprotein CzcO
MTGPSPLLNRSGKAGADPGAASLAELEARFSRELDLLLVPPAKAWLEPRLHPDHGPMLDVAIVGAGMAGLAAALALRRLGITRAALFDRSPEGHEGPWLTYARMEVLRSPPELTGPALGFPSLTFRAWYEAQFGHEAWPRLHRIPRTQWMDYLRWYRRMVAMPIENDCEVTDIDGGPDHVVLTLRTAAGVRRVTARRVILANGRDGLGGEFVPELFRAIRGERCAHSSDAIDFAGLAGKTVGVIGAGASAVDNAAEALEHGAKRVAMLVRRSGVPRINRGMGIGSPGMWHGFHQLPPAQRWAIVQFIADSAIPPPRDSMLRCSRHGNFSVITGCEPRSVSNEGDRILIDTSRGLLAFDFLILATGFTVDWSRRPELDRIARNVLLWRDRFEPPDGRPLEQAADPFLGPAFEFLERTPGATPWVERVHCFSFPAFLSHGPLTGDIPAISVGAERMAQGIAGSLFCEDFERNWQRLLTFDTPELRGDEFTAASDISAFFAKGT